MIAAMTIPNSRPRYIPPISYHADRLEQAIEAFRFLAVNKTHRRELRNRGADNPGQRMANVVAFGGEAFADDSGDEDFEPGEKSSKKKNDKKKRPAAFPDNERYTKRNKTRARQDNAYSSFHFTTAAGRQFLADLGPIELQKPSSERPHEEPPSYWTKYARKDPKLFLQPGWESYVRHNVLDDPEPMDLDDPDLGKTTLRSGKSVDKLRNERRRPYDLDDRDISQTSLRIEHLRSDHIPTPSNVRLHTSGTITSPIEISDDSDDDFIIISSRIRDSSQSRSSSRDTQAAGSEFTITTCYAHPIDFEAPPSQCDFCPDYRTGIFGINAVEVQVLRDFEKPWQLHEMGNGLRQAGHPATKMCQDCALQYLTIAECHAKSSDSQILDINELKVPKELMKEYGKSTNLNTERSPVVIV